jgi:Na+/H+-dicarboxylate symporter
MSDSTSASAAQATELRGLMDRWFKTPLYVRILGGFILGIILGMVLGKQAHFLEVPSKLVLRILGALAPPLVLLAVVQALVKAELPKGSAARLLGLLILNTCVAIFIGLFVANVVRPGSWSHIEPPEKTPPKDVQTAFEQFLNNVPVGILEPFTRSDRVLGVILIALALGIALRKQDSETKQFAIKLVDMSLKVTIQILHWVIEVIPLAVLGIVGFTVGMSGFGKFIALGWFVFAVLLALALQVAYYLIRIRFGSWVRPRDVLQGMRDALVMAFSTGSSTATMPLTYECLTQRVGVRERSASLGGLIGANFNNDGTALYEAMSALFVSQLLGLNLSLSQQLLVVLTSIVASVGAAGIPEAGLVTMTLVFNAVGLPTHYIAILLAVDWFLDRCRTAVNVMGDVNVSCLLDGKTREVPAPPVEAAYSPAP